MWPAHSRRQKAQAQLDELLTEASEERKRTIPDELRDRITQARQPRRHAMAQAKHAEQNDYTRVAPALHAIRDAKRKAREAAHGKFVQNRGLYWATFNDVGKILLGREYKRPSRRRCGCQVIKEPPNLVGRAARRPLQACS